MENIIDTRGLSCPQPVLLTIEKLQKISQGEIVILVDTDTSRENVTRAALSLGWQLKEVQPQGLEYRLRLVKG
jgi:tRNA 2-thiouridine synthesizing protein A